MMQVRGWVLFALVALQACRPSHQQTTMTCPPGPPGPQSEAICRTFRLSALNVGPLSQQPLGACCSFILPPMKLLETGTSIVDPQSMAQQTALQTANCSPGGRAYKACVDPPPFYRKYSNTYTTDYRVGIPIISSGNASDVSLHRVRAAINYLFKWVGRVIPTVREHVGRAYVRVSVRACGEKWTDQPIGQKSNPEFEQGGGSRSMPTTGVEESGLPTSPCHQLSEARWPADLEEFFHTIHDIAIRELDPDAYAAIVCLSVRDTKAGKYYPNEEAKDASKTPAERLAITTADIGGDIVSSLSYEYFVSAAAVWQGLPLADFEAAKGNVTRAGIKAYLPDLACLLARYFPDVGEEDGTLCSMNSSHADPLFCTRFPGSCYCDGGMTAGYLGPAIDRSQCMTLLQIKENSGNGDASWTEGEQNQRVTCKGCVTQGCESDRGLVARNRTILTNVASGSEAVSVRGVHGLFVLATAALHFLIVN